MLKISFASVLFKGCTTGNYIPQPNKEGGGSKNGAACAVLSPIHLARPTANKCGATPFGMLIFFVSGDGILILKISSSVQHGRSGGGGGSSGGGGGGGYLSR